jgi:hypothetical protein
MSASTEIYARADSSYVAFAQSVANLLGISFQVIRGPEHDEGPLYRAVQYGALIDLLSVDDVFRGLMPISDDPELPIDSFTYFISVDARTGNGPEENDRVRENLSRFIFDRLKATGDYALLMVDDSIGKLDAHHP